MPLPPLFNRLRPTTSNEPLTPVLLMLNRPSLLTLITTLLLACHIQAQEMPDYEPIPTPPEEQLKIFKEMAEKSQFSVYETDDAGNITFVGFANRGGRNKGPNEKQIKHDDDRPGLTNEDFGKILYFPKLEAVATQFQRITNKGYAVLTAFPGMVAINLSNLENGPWAEDKQEEMRDRISPELFRYLDGMRNLRYWNTTHSFGFQDEEDVLQELQGFPELRYLNVDVGHADDFDELYPFIQKSPKLEFLKLHRTTLSEAQVKMILDALPNLKRLDIKPRGNKPGERWSYQSLALIKNYPNLESLRLIHGAALPLPWENGLEHLVEAKNLKYFEFPRNDKNAPDPEDLKRLQEARPDLVILPLLDREGFRAARDEMEIEATQYNMGIGPG